MEWENVRIHTSRFRHYQENLLQDVLTRYGGAAVVLETSRTGVRDGPWPLTPLVARDLLNLTVKAFYKKPAEDLSRDQLDARDNFIDLYRDQTKEFADELNHPKQSAPRWNLPKFHELLDRFFFFASCEDHEYGVQRATSREKDPKVVHTESWDEDKIQVIVGNAERHFNLNEALSSLLHEMVHKYLESFTCMCKECSKNAGNTIGMAGDRHGPVFQALHRLILSAIRGWHKDLKSVDSIDCPGDAISRYAAHEARVAVSLLEDKDRKALFLREPKGQSRLLIGIIDKDLSEDRTVVVSENLMITQMKHETALKKREQTKRKAKSLEQDESGNDDEEEEEEEEEAEKPAAKKSKSNFKLDTADKADKNSTSSIKSTKPTDSAASKFDTATPANSEDESHSANDNKTDNSDKSATNVTNPDEEAAK
ncbi:hypothetical protein BJ170DRAFT_677110 [Xylariales sp. AK1849]|nr:hypothetical protein BJ170DRAFT_677110 [Xylariales sp. AK1849]